jgi:hypothetical protein
MATITIKKGAEKRLMRDVPKEGVALYKATLRKILEDFAKEYATKISADGIDISEIEGGFHLKVTANTANDPWTPRPGGSGWIIRPGTFGGVMPEIGGVRLDAASAPSIAVGIGVNYIYLKVTVDYAIVEDFVAGASIEQGDVTVIASTNGDASALDSPEDGEFHILIATISSGRVTAQPYHASLDWSFSDTGTGDSAIQLSVFT